MRNLLTRLWKDDRGQDLVEYAMLVVLVSLGSVAAIGQVATAMSQTFSNTATTLSSS
jgi:pilus assembly protein Flp/PilA